MWKIKANNNEGEIYVYGEIGNYINDDKYDAAAFRNQIEGLGSVNKLNIYINSPGGDVFDATAMLAILARHKAFKHVYIDGLAASAASILAMAGDKITIAQGGMMMIHSASSFIYGNANELREMISLLEKADESMAGIYAQRTQIPKEKIAEMMKAETWLSANEALSQGFADEISEKQVKMVACAKGIIMNDQYVSEKYAKKIQNKLNNSITATEIDELCQIKASIEKMRRNK